MHVQIITFNLKDISEEEYRKVAESVAPAFAGLPGLISKHWLADSETNTYGGTYVWQDREAMRAYAETEIFAAMAANPHFENVTVRDFAVLEGPTSVTGDLAGAAA
jgi:heme-degrading monooxygenase HmoA